MIKFRPPSTSVFSSRLGRHFGPGALGTWRRKLHELAPAPGGLVALGQGARALQGAAQHAVHQLLLKNVFWLQAKLGLEMTRMRNRRHHLQVPDFTQPPWWL